jgi:hypothetical protein
MDGLDKAALCITAGLGIVFVFAFRPDNTFQAFLLGGAAALISWGLKEVARYSRG